MRFKEFLKEAEEFDVWVKERDALEAKADEADKAIKALAGDNKGGLVPDEIKDSSEYKKADKEFNTAFKALQDFNKKSPKEFKVRASKLKRGKRMDEYYSGTMERKVFNTLKDNGFNCGNSTPNEVWDFINGKFTKLNFADIDDLVSDFFQGGNCEQHIFQKWFGAKKK